MRIQKLIAFSGICSRREAERRIAEGRVKLNGEVVTQLGIKVDLDKDVIYVDDILCKAEENKIYILINKPVGVVSTAKDTHDRQTVIDLVDIKERVYPVGRLDKESSGLLILTNDGDFTNQMTHPKYHISKKYKVKIKGHPDDEFYKNFKDGVVLDGYKTKPTLIKKTRELLHSTVVEITLFEGRNRQIRKMCSILGHDVLELERIAIGFVSDRKLKQGNWRYLTIDEKESLLREVASNGKNRNYR